MARRALQYTVGGKKLQINANYIEMRSLARPSSRGPEEEGERRERDHFKCFINCVRKTRRLGGRLGKKKEAGRKEKNRGRKRRETWLNAHLK